MNLDVVNKQNEKVGTLELRDDLFGGRVAGHLVWESVVHAHAAERRGTHMTKTRGLVSGTGKKVERGALRAALAAKLADQSVVVVDALGAETAKTKAAVEMLARLGAGAKAVLVDVKADEKLALAVRNVAGVRFVESGRLTARDVADSGRLVVTRAALERLQEVLG